MRFDMHCHTKEGSLDGKIPLKEYVLHLKNLGFDGMLITDHNSYKAYRYYIKHRNDPEFQDFTVLKGIEYDTCDSGHILVIMPENVRLPILELRGLPVKLLIEIVHAFHGILGPAHPMGEKYLSLTNCNYYKKHPEIVKEFDFIETYNACESSQANRDAALLAEQYHLPGTGGSDAHKIRCAGMAYTDMDADISTESDLIRYLKTTPAISCGGSHYSGTTREQLGTAYNLLLDLFCLYNKCSNFFRRSRREMEIENILSSVPQLFTLKDI